MPSTSPLSSDHNGDNGGGQKQLPAPSSSSNATISQANPSTILLEEGLRTARAALGDDHPDLLPWLHRLALWYEFLQDYHHALPLYEQQLTILRSLPPPSLDHHKNNLPLICHNLALIYLEQGQVDKAISLLQGALQCHRQRQEEAGDGGGGEVDHSQFISCLHFLGKAHEQMGDHHQALVYYQELVTIHRERLAASTTPTSSLRQSLSTSLYDLSMVYMSMDQPSQALPLREEVVDMMIEDGGTRRPPRPAEWRRGAATRRSFIWPVFLYGAAGHGI